MIKKSITYTNFLEEEVTEDFYFHLGKAELINLELSEDGSFGNRLLSIVASNDHREMVAEFTKIIGQAYGIRTPDGRGFRKSAEEQETFLSSPAFDALFMELMTDPKTTAEFIQGIVPKDLANDPKVLKAVEDVKLSEGDTLSDEQKAEYSGLTMPIDKDGIVVPWWNREPTEKELTAMTKAQLMDVMRRKNSGRQLYQA